MLAFPLGTNKKRTVAKQAVPCVFDFGHPVCGCGYRLAAQSVRFSMRVPSLPVAGS